MEDRVARLSLTFACLCLTALIMLNLAFTLAPKAMSHLLEVLVA